MPMKKRVGRGGFVPEGDGEEEMVEIYIPLDTLWRLQAFGDWRQKSSYATRPSDAFHIKTWVPRSALENSVFYPERCGCHPADIAERCEDVMPRKPRRK